MLIVKKIRPKRYFFSSLVGVGVCLLFLETKQEVMAFFIAHIAVCINLAMLVEAVGEVIEKTHRNKKIVLLIVGKFIVLAIGLNLAIQMMSNKLLIPVIDYIYQIFALALALDFRRGD